MLDDADLLELMGGPEGCPVVPERRPAAVAILRTVLEEAGESAARATGEWVAAYDAIELSAIRGHAVAVHGIDLAAFPDAAYPEPGAG